ncbi:MAG: hypothetical protein ACKOXB_10545 [Flavobacteriales bacterium]
MNSLRTYIQERINIFLWSGVALLLIALSLTDLSFSTFQLYAFPFVLFFLLTLRLSDDLASAEIDKGKENRSYTNDTTKKELQKFSFVAQGILVATLAIFDYKRAVIALAFLVVNHLLYAVLFNITKLRYFLPLLKYAFIIYVLNLELSFNILAVVFAFITFESVEDQSFPMNKYFRVSSATLSFIMLLFNSLLTLNIMLFLPLCLIGMILVKYPNRYSAYAFLTVFILTHLLLIYPKCLIL